MRSGNLESKMSKDNSLEILKYNDFYENPTVIAYFFKDNSNKSFKLKFLGGNPPYSVDPIDMLKIIQESVLQLRADEFFKNEVPLDKVREVEHEIAVDKLNKFKEKIKK